MDAPCSLTATIIEKDGLRFELLAYSKPGVIGKPHHRRNNLGLTHLSFFADDVDAAAASMVEFGGTLVPDTRVGLDDPGAAQYTFVADPDGNRSSSCSSPQALLGELGPRRTRPRLRYHAQRLPLGLTHE